MRIAVLSDGPAWLSAGRLRVHRPYGIYVDALAEHFDHVLVCNPVATAPIPEAQYELQSPNISVEPLPYFGRVAESVPLLPRCARGIWRASRSWDVLYVWLPTPLGFIAYLCARHRGIPVVLSIEGDLEAQYERGRYQGFSNATAYVGVKLFERLTRWMVDRAVTITQGEALREKYRRNHNRVLNIPWSPVSEQMIVHREDTCTGPGYRLLFVGALLEKKGIFVLLETARILRKYLDNFVVTYVGTGPLAEKLACRVREAGLDDHVELKGGVFGERALLDEFDAADLFLLPTYAEGFPRVIFEAMARGVPVISTRVSGIPTLVKDGRDALLVNPGSPEEVAEAILKISGDGPLRRSLIKHGREMAEEYTLEKTVRRRVEVIRMARTALRRRR